MIFSLFGKKDPRAGDRRRGGGDAAVTTPGPPTGAPPPARAADPREIARQTAAKIDAIESEMIAAERPPAPRAVGGQAGLAGNVYVPSSKVAPASPVAPPVAARLAVPVGPAAGPRSPGPPAGAPGPQPDTSIILGDAADGHSLEVSGSTLPQAFEEAAVLYANGQATAAAMILWQSIKHNQLANHARQGWAMLFDLYQASGRREEFENIAIDYSARFECSPPTWDDGLAPPPATEKASAGAPTAAVTLPAALDAQAVRQLEQVQRLAQRNRAVAIDVSAVRSVDAIGADLLLRVLQALVKADRDLTVYGADELRAVVGGAIEAGRRDPSDACWLLCLELLRLLGRQQDFDDVAIDYCVTYEVSPPSWEPMPPTARAASAGAPAAAASGGAASASASSGSVVEADDALVLRGEIVGRAQDVLAALRARAAERSEVVVDCRHLRRLDFVAAGELLNEVVALRTGGKYLVFREVNQMVTALMTVMGLPDLVDVRPLRH